MEWFTHKTECKYTRTECNFSIFFKKDREVVIAKINTDIFNSLHSIDWINEVWILKLWNYSDYMSALSYDPDDSIDDVLMYEVLSSLARHVAGWEKFQNSDWIEFSFFWLDLTKFINWDCSNCVCLMQTIFSKAYDLIISLLKSNWISLQHNDQIVNIKHFTKSIESSVDFKTDFEWKILTSLTKNWKLNAKIVFFPINNPKQIMHNNLLNLKPLDNSNMGWCNVKWFVDTNWKILIQLTGASVNYWPLKIQDLSVWFIKRIISEYLFAKKGLGLMLELDSLKLMK